MNNDAELLRAMQARVFLLAEREGQFDSAIVDVLVQVIDELRTNSGNVDEKVMGLAAPSALTTARHSIAREIRQ